MQVRESLQHRRDHLMVSLVEYSPRNAAMSPDKSRAGKILKNLLELMKVLILLMDSDRCAVLVDEDGQVA